MFGELGKTVKAYLAHYGGLSEVFSSSLFWISVLLTAALAPIWLLPDWWDLPIGILPNLLGFTLGGYAIFLSFGDKSFFKVLAGHDSKGKALFLSINATFVHFVTLQFLALFLSMFAKAYYFETPLWIGDLLGKSSTIIVSIIAAVTWFCFFLVFIYSLATGVGLALNIFKLSTWYDAFLVKQHADDDNQNEAVVHYLSAISEDLKKLHTEQERSNRSVNH